MVPHRNALVDRMEPGQGAEPPRAPKRTVGTDSAGLSTRVALLTMHNSLTTVVLTDQERGSWPDRSGRHHKPDGPSERPDLRPGGICSTRTRQPHMRRSLSPDSRSVWQPSLPPVVEGMLLDVVADGFVVYCCGARVAPTALVASYEWEHYLDLVTVRDFDRITTARVPKQGTVDIFAPEVVVWVYEGPARYALRPLLDLVHPAHPEAPTAGYPASPSLHIPRAEQRPMTIRLPSSGRALARATRLAAGMTAHGDDFGH